MTYIPPFDLTPALFSLVQKISRELGLLAGLKLSSPPIRLRRDNAVKTIQASLEIEGNTLSIAQITALLDGKRVMGPEKDILEAQNALVVYQKIDQLNPLSQHDLLLAHRLLMKELVPDAGRFREGNVGIVQGDRLTHMAPPSHRVHALMSQLFEFLKGHPDLSWLLKACVFHYEFEFIHPFSDGNGRMGRLWQQCLLMKDSPLFAYISVETMIRLNQQEYYRVLRQCDQVGNSTQFIDFSLHQILNALEAYRAEVHSSPMDGRTRIDYALGVVGTQWFSRKQYVECHPDISLATASRDLNQGVLDHVLETKGSHNQTRYRRVFAAKSP